MIYETEKPKTKRELDWELARIAKRIERLHGKGKNAMVAELVANYRAAEKEYTNAAQ